ncbi:hypothetical protein G9U51_00190 [Calidifontibacter sp. DB0510]|uniref:Uncharacterized protein n=1 Tax=Metallococcus carri TaxID=1656884 RepID=A0A967AXE9_9MICO|nr:hypothetical protein [Metallococcus carri]NHN54202.1 hypothetical protein [Metallococcus carri]NOP36958.1 hypothetical protein [Calidifontibacter sp. DB2511S]
MAAAGGSQQTTSARPTAGVTSVPVTGTFADGSTFSGAISNLRAFTQNGVLMVTGTITGTGLPAGGTTFTAPLKASVPNAAAAPAAATGAAAPAAAKGCNVLTLNLGPLHLDLLGLVIDLAPVNLNVTAVPGAGNLLGNLLCAVAGLLDGGGPLSGITGLLNNLLSALGLAAPKVV